MYNSNKKPQVRCEVLARRLAMVFVTELEANWMDRSKIPWINGAKSLDPTELISEWAIVQMLIRSVSFTASFRDQKIARLLLDLFHEFTWETLVQSKVLRLRSDIESILHERYQEYYTAMAGSPDWKFKLMRIAELFLRQCHVSSMEGVIVVQISLQFTLEADKRFAKSLENDMEIVV